jgi:hypothetical protein
MRAVVLFGAGDGLISSSCLLYNPAISSLVAGRQTPRWRTGGSSAVGEEELMKNSLKTTKVNKREGKQTTLLGACVVV